MFAKDTSFKIEHYEPLNQDRDCSQVQTGFNYLLAQIISGYISELAKKIDENNKKLLELRIRSVEEQNKQQKLDGENTEQNLGNHTVKGTVRLLEGSRFSQF